MYSEMKEPQPAFAVYSPPAYGFPFLAVVLEPDGTATAKPFDTAAEAVAFNRKLAHALPRPAEH
jgi:hypothetical protein